MGRAGGGSSHPGRKNSKRGSLGLGRNVQETKQRPQQGQSTRNRGFGGRLGTQRRVGSAESRVPALAQCDSARDPGEASESGSLHFHPGSSSEAAEARVSGQFKNRRLSALTFFSNRCARLRTTAADSHGAPRLQAHGHHAGIPGAFPAGPLPPPPEWKPADRSPGTLTTHSAGEQRHGRVQERTGRRREPSQAGRPPPPQ